MKNNNVFKYIFIIFIIILIIGAAYILYNQKQKTEQQETDKQSQVGEVQILDKLTMGICNYDTMNPLLTNNKEIINIDKLIFEPLITIT